MDQHTNDPSNSGARTREREVIVTNNGGGPGIGGVVAAVLGAIVVLLLAWMLFFNGNGESSVENPLPDDVNVNIDSAPGGEGGGGQG